MRGGGSPFARRTIYAAALAAALGLAVYFFLVPLLRKKAAFRARMARVRKEMAAEKDLNRELRRERRLLEEKDPTYLEKYARDNFGWAREGETVYRIEK